MKLKPINGKILVEIPGKSKDDLIIPDSISDSQQEGIILALSTRTQTFYNFKVGDKIRWERYAEADGAFEYDGKQVVLIAEDKVTAVWSNDSDS